MYIKYINSFFKRVILLKAILDVLNTSEKACNFTKGKHSSMGVFHVF